MAKHSIRDLERITGVKAHTIRMWEQRYGLLSPQRTGTNIRYYTCEDLKLLLNVVLLSGDGYRISAISKMSAEEIRESVMSKCEKCKAFETQINMLTAAMVDFDESRFEKIISRDILQFGFEKTILRIVFPFFRQLGLFWQAGVVSPAQEHFVSNIVRQKILVATDGQDLNADGNSRKFILFLPEGEFHELGLLFANYIIKSRGNRAVYLGQNTPVSSVKTASDSQNPEFLLTMVTTRISDANAKTYLTNLSREFPGKAILAGGGGIENGLTGLPDNVVTLADADGLIRFLETV